MVCIISAVGQSLFLLSAAVLSENVWAYPLGRLFAVLFCFYQTVGFTLCVELINPVHRGKVAMFAETIASGFGIIIPSINGWLMNNWVAQLYFSSACLAVTVPFYCLADESFRWYFSKGKFDEGKKALESFCRKAKYNYNESLAEKLATAENEMENVKTEHFYQILKFPALFLNVLKVQFIFVVQCLIYFGVLFVKYPGGILYNNSINGVASMVAGVALLILFSSKYRFRRQILIFQYFVAGVLAIALAFLSKYHPESILLTVCGFFMYMMICGSFTMLFLYTTEVLPTSIRSQMFGFISAFGRLGSALGMQLVKFGTFNASLTFGITALSASLMVISLPETYNRPLMASMDEAEDKFSKKPKAAKITSESEKMIEKTESRKEEP